MIHRSLLLVLLSSAAGCHAPRLGRVSRGDSTHAVAPSDSAADSVGAPVVHEPTVIAFRLPAADTLDQDGRDQLADWRAYTRVVAPLLRKQGITLSRTTADSVVVILENGPTRVIRLSGLDYPFGYVLVEPGYPETILTGVSTDDELIDQVTSYFGLDDDDDSSGTTPQVVFQSGGMKAFLVSGRVIH